MDKLKSQLEKLEASKLASEDLLEMLKLIVEAIEKKKKS